jgi:multidrug efflux pump subunit AcrB
VADVFMIEPRRSCRRTSQRGLENNPYIQVGLVLMIALASKNAILVVKFARNLYAEGMSITSAQWKPAAGASAPLS